MSRSALRRATLFFASALGALAIFAPVAFAAGPPIISVKAPTGEEISLTSTSVKTEINPNGGGSGNYKIEYGKTKLYGKTTPVVNLQAPGEVPTTVYIPLYGLEAMTTYHFQVVATNSLGTTKSGDIEFENLKDWKVEGKRVTELPEMVGFSSGKAATLEFLGRILKVNTQIQCTSTQTASGKLGVEYNGLSHFNCTTRFNGIPEPACNGEVNPTLDRNLQQLGTLKILFTGSECFVGKSWPLQGVGFNVQPTPEATTFTDDAWGQGVFNATAEGTWDIHLSNLSWSLTGTNAGKKFGIS